MTQHIREEVIEIKKKVSFYLNIGRFDAAEKLLKSTIAEYGPLANIYNLLGTTFHRQSRFPEAIEYFRKSIESNPNYIEANINLAATLCDLSRYEEAQKVFEQIDRSIEKTTNQPLMILGKIANAHSETGKLYEEAGMYRDAIREYSAALKLFKPLQDIQLRLAQLYLKINNLSDAQKCFEELLQLSPNHSVARSGLGIVQFKQGRRDLAIQSWSTAFKFTPQDHTAKAFHHLAEHIIAN